MQGDVVLARHEDGYRFQAERPMEGDELVNPSAPFAKRKGRPKRPTALATPSSGGCPSSLPSDGRDDARAPSSSGQER